eukprot:scaffold6007_cov183-Amphora_coffeaeformis.AAC.6
MEPKHLKENKGLVTAEDAHVSVREGEESLTIFSSDGPLPLFLFSQSHHTYNMLGMTKQRYLKERKKTPKTLLCPLS